jgi:hypothetical protein
VSIPIFFCHCRCFLFELTIQQAALTSKTQCCFFVGTQNNKTTETKLIGKTTSVWFLLVFRLRRHRHRGSGFKQYVATTDSIHLSVVVFLNNDVDNSTDMLTIKFTLINMLRDKSQHGFNFTLTWGA